MKYPHYFKPIPAGITHVDVYRVLALFEVTDPCIQHAVKKLLVAGGRGAKDAARDVQEAIDALARWQGMRAEEVPAQTMPVPADHVAFHPALIPKPCGCSQMTCRGRPDCPHGVQANNA